MCYINILALVTSMVNLPLIATCLVKKLQSTVWTDKVYIKHLVKTVFHNHLFILFCFSTSPGNIMNAGSHWHLYIWKLLSCFTVHIYTLYKFVNMEFYCQDLIQVCSVEIKTGSFKHKHHCRLYNCNKKSVWYTENRYWALPVIY